MCIREWVQVVTSVSFHWRVEGRWGGVPHAGRGARASSTVAPRPRESGHFVLFVLLRNCPRTQSDLDIADIMYISYLCDEHTMKVFIYFSSYILLALFIVINILDTWKNVL